MPEEITFEQGYEELTQILDSLEQGEVAVAETVEKCRRAKALEHALRGFLEDRKGELERIEAGDRAAGDPDQRQLGAEHAGRRQRPGRRSRGRNPLLTATGSCRRAGTAAGTSRSR